MTSNLELRFSPVFVHCQNYVSSIEAILNERCTVAS